MSEVSGTSCDWNVSFQALIERFQGVESGGFVCLRLSTAKV